jgi:hypothetical protein
LERWIRRGRTGEEIREGEEGEKEEGILGKNINKYM